MLMKYMPTDIQSEFDRLGRVVDEIFRGRTEAPTNWTPRVDIQSTAEALVFHVEVPGFVEKDLEVELTGGYLTIRGHRERESKDEKANFVHVERMWGSFTRQFPLPVGFEAEKVHAVAKDGLLVITVPRKEKALPRKVAIKKN